MRHHLILRVQAAYYVSAGVWPLLSMGLFERVTGKKSDRWLVQTVGMLAACIGSSLFVAARDEAIAPASLTLALSTACAFASIDVVHVSRRRISPVYLLDAGAELAIVAALLL